jgi:bifunctional non-homologous end joining protein LigD
VVEDLRAIDAETAVLDGEVVVLDSAGRPRFGLLQNRINLTKPADIQRAAKVYPAQLMLFDLLHLNGQSLLRKPYDRRRELLEALVQPPPGSRVHMPPIFGRSECGDGDQQAAGPGGRCREASRFDLPAGPPNPDLAQDETASCPRGDHRWLASRQGPP